MPDTWYQTPDLEDQTPDHAHQMPKYQTWFLGPLSGLDQTPDENHHTPDLPIRRLIKFIKRLVFKIEFEVFDHFVQLLDQTPDALASDA